jgi:hypothetical protein
MGSFFVWFLAAFWFRSLFVHPLSVVLARGFRGFVPLSPYIIYMNFRNPFPASDWSRFLSHCWVSMNLEPAIGFIIRFHPPHWARLDPRLQLQQHFTTEPETGSQAHRMAHAFLHLPVSPPLPPHACTTSFSLCSCLRFPASYPEKDCAPRTVQSSSTIIGSPSLPSTTAHPLPQLSLPASSLPAARPLLAVSAANDASLLL